MAAKEKYTRSTSHKAPKSIVVCMLFSKNGSTREKLNLDTKKNMKNSKFNVGNQYVNL